MSRLQIFSFSAASAGEWVRIIEMGQSGHPIDPFVQRSAAGPVKALLPLVVPRQPSPWALPETFAGIRAG